MFSLLITVLSVALVTALLLASVLYLNNTHAHVQAAARASTVLSQAEQLAGAARIFHQYEGNWPADVDALISKQYLTSRPTFNNVPWRTLGATTTVYLLPSAVDEGACRALNQQVQHVDGVRVQAVATRQVQCFGAAAPFSVLVRIEDSATLAADLAAVLPGATLVASDAGATWSVTP